VSRKLLYRAADRIDEAGAAADRDVSDRLSALAEQLRSQADRDATPALGTLDRVNYKLRAIGAETGDPTVEERIASAREDVLSFLETLDDRGMNQHGWSEE